MERAVPVPPADDIEASRTFMRLPRAPAVMPSSVIDAILHAHGIPGPWHALPPLGVANLIYATGDVVLRVATDHEQAECDARTESVAAPAAYAAGIRTPRLIAFDDARVLIDRPYSIWERVHGETAGSCAMTPGARDAFWRAVGREIARVHVTVTECSDPNGWLDAPSRHRDLGDLVARLRASGHVSAHDAADMAALVRDLEPHVEASVPPRFVHDDLHAGNMMCAPGGELLAIIDWGDAGWGDPSLDFRYVPLDMIETVRSGYEREAPGVLGAQTGARIAWDQLHHGLERLMELRGPVPRVDQLRRVAGV